MLKLKNIYANADNAKDANAGLNVAPEGGYHRDAPHLNYFLNCLCRDNFPSHSLTNDFYIFGLVLSMHSSLHLAASAADLFKIYTTA